MELTDQQLLRLITYLKYYGTFPFPCVFTSRDPAEVLSNVPEGALLEAGYLALDVNKHKGVGCLQVTYKGKRAVWQLGQTDPLRLAHLCVQAGYLGQAVVHIGALSVEELPPFIVHELSVIREYALERFGKLTNGTP